MSFSLKRVVDLWQRHMFNCTLTSSCRKFVPVNKCTVFMNKLGKFDYLVKRLRLNSIAALRRRTISLGQTHA